MFPRQDRFQVPWLVPVEQTQFRVRCLVDLVIDFVHQHLIVVPAKYWDYELKGLLDYFQGELFLAISLRSFRGKVLSGFLVVFEKLHWNKLDGHVQVLCDTIFHPETPIRSYVPRLQQPCVVQTSGPH